MSRIFPEAFTSGIDTCRWCVQQCQEEEKYEMLVNCIRIQNEFSLIGKKISLILGKTSPKYFKNVIELFENLTDNMLIESTSARVKDKNDYAENVWKLPGCSQIFQLAQSLGQSNLKDPK